MKKLFILTLALLLSVWAHVRAEEVSSNIPVKMTNVNYDKPNLSYGEIAQVTAMSGNSNVSCNTSHSKQIKS